MRVRVVSRLPKGIPKSPGIIACTDLRINKGRLRAKLVVFDNAKNLQLFWNRYLGGGLGRYCKGAVSSLQKHITDYKIPGKPKEWLECDRRYFCVIGLCRNYLTMRVISHESVHAGYAFARRVKRTTWVDQVKRLDEEAIAYPTGEIAREIAWFCQKNKLYPD